MQRNKITGTMTPTWFSILSCFFSQWFVCFYQHFCVSFHFSCGESRNFYSLFFCHLQSISNFLSIIVCVFFWNKETSITPAMTCGPFSKDLYVFFAIFIIRLYPHFLIWSFFFYLLKMIVFFLWTKWPNQKWICESYFIVFFYFFFGQ